MLQKRWNILTADDDKVQQLYASLKIHPVLCKVLTQRFLDDFDKAKQFFRPQLTDLHDLTALYAAFLKRYLAP